MPLISVLSPHRDDAAFSLGLCLSLWSQRDIRLQVLNFFTVSGYGPHAACSDAAGISAERRREDRAALASISAGIKIIDCGLLDAPIRLGVPATAVFNAEMQAFITEEQLRPIAARIQALPRSSLIVAPLGFGNHVDHFAVHEAALDSAAGQKLAFYEDLPYATWTARSEFETRIVEVQRKMKLHLRPLVLRNRHAFWFKRRIACRYRSQITREEGAQIGSWTSKYGGGERIWIPGLSREWNAIAAGDGEPFSAA